MKIFNSTTLAEAMHRASLSTAPVAVSVSAVLTDDEINQAAGAANVVVVEPPRFGNRQECYTLLNAGGYWYDLLLWSLPLWQEQQRQDEASGD